jgi:hypothetical protein
MLGSAPVAVHRFVVAAIVLFAVGTIGCSDRACFRVSRSTTQCPSANGAKDHFGDCSDIESIDSDGALVAGNLCCYDVTRSLDGIPGPGPCPGMGGGVSSRSSSGDVSPGSQVATSSGMGGAGGVHTSSSTGGPGGFGGTANGGGGFGGGASCDSLPCGFTPEQPLSGCLSCAESDSMLCADQSNACDVDMQCKNFKNCIGGCNISDQPCISDCRAMYPNGASLFTALLQCSACMVCANSCAGSPVMSLAMCGGGGGGVGGAGGATGVGGAGGTP